MTTAKPSEIYKAPWSEDVVLILKERQLLAPAHPYTCGTDSRHRLLEPMDDGWHCLDCGYTQDWCRWRDTTRWWIDRGNDDRGDVQ